MAEPWKTLKAMADLVLVHAPIAERGRYYHRHRAIVLRGGLTQAERRSTLAHELVHAERGDEPCCSPELDARQERVVEQLAARRLIPLDALVAALMWAQDDHELADELWVDVDTVRSRREGLTLQERVEIEKRLWAAERGA